jgi:hypothetical protein
MPRKTRKQTTKKRHLHGIKTIPELRQSFDYIDEFVKQRVQSGIPKEQLVKEIQTEWYRVFGKRIQKKNATAFAEHLLQQMKGRRSLRAMTRKTKGGAAPFMDPTTQPGTYLSSGQIPTPGGQYPMANGAPSVYGSLTQYIHKGFAYPEIAGKGEYESPMPSATMGSNRALMGGGRPLGGGRKKGGAILDSLRSSITQAFARPIPSDAPPSVLQTAQSGWNGRPIGLSPNPVQHPTNYALKDSMFPKMVNVRIDV